MLAKIREERLDRLHSLLSEALQVTQALIRENPDDVTLIIEMNACGELIEEAQDVVIVFDAPPGQ